MMEKRIAFLRRASKVFKFFALLWSVLYLIYAGLTLYTATYFVRVITADNPATTFLGIFIQVLLLSIPFLVVNFIIWTIAVALALQADSADEMLKLKWGVQDLRRKLIAVRGEEETRG